jgi:hypothetical protein
MEERFYGNPEKRIKGACDQLIDGDNAFGFIEPRRRREQYRTDIETNVLWEFYLN